MLRDCRGRRVAVAARESCQDGAMLAHGFGRAPGAIAAGQPHRIDQGCAGVQHGDCHAVVRQRIDRAVEGAVRRGKRRGVTCRGRMFVGVRGPARGLQRVPRRARSSFTRGQRLQGAAHGIELAQGAAIERRQGGAAVRAQHHHTVARQVQQRLADRALADAIAALQLGQRQVRADRPGAAGDVGQHSLAHAQIGRRGEGGFGNHSAFYRI